MRTVTIMCFSIMTVATESQDESPYDYAPDEIECPEVFPYKETITVYREANGEPHGDI